MFSPLCFIKKSNFYILYTLFLTFQFEFIQPAYKHSFISVYHIICKLVCFKQTGNCSDLGLSFFFFLFLFFFVFFCFFF